MVLDVLLEGGTIVDGLESPPHQAIVGLGLGDDVTQNLARVHILEYPTVDAVDELALLELSSSG